MSTRSGFLVLVQLVTIGYLVLTGPVFSSQLEFAIIELLGIFLALWGIVTLRSRNWNIAPEVRQSGKLVTSGPYRFIRHPMYSSLLLVCLMWIIACFSWTRLTAWVALAGDILIKMRYEERLLSHAFPDYESYQKRTKKLIPFVY
jgi:protein-S-isoprenylcysteine O-methyltransferase Ste14